MSGYFADRTSFPSQYWATLHPPNAEQDLCDEFHRLNEIHINTDLHDPAVFNFNPRSILTPGTRTCSSLLSEMLKPDSRPSSPTTHDLLSDHGSVSTHSTPPVCKSPKRRHISFGPPATKEVKKVEEKRVVKPTCKSTLDVVLRKEQIAMIDEVEEEEYEDDGYIEDIESDGEVELPATPGIPIFQTAPPLESDLPDTTDFAAGTFDEDQPACVAFNTAVKDRDAKPLDPRDIDPTFPDSGSESEVTEKSRWSPPVVNTLRRTLSLPRRTKRDCKPLRAMMIKQSNEQRAQRRREKKEIRQKIENGHEKMAVHASRRKVLVNPCIIRPVVSI